MSSDEKSEVVIFRLSKEERDMLEKLAHIKNKSISSTLRGLIVKEYSGEKTSIAQECMNNIRNIAESFLND